MIEQCFGIHDVVRCTLLVKFFVHYFTCGPPQNISLRKVFKFPVPKVYNKTFDERESSRGCQKKTASPFFLVTKKEATTWHR